MTEDYGYDYIAYIDEAGDPGLKKVKPFDENGSSEWLVVSAVLLRAEHVENGETASWAKDWLTSCCGPQAKAFHFRELNDARQRLACETLNSKPVRAFAVCSNKKNMKNWKNPFASRKTEEVAGIKRNQRWFYYWVTRILLEKVTDYAARRGNAELGRPGRLKVVFSERGGIYYNELETYYRILFNHDNNGTQHVTYDTLTWSVMDSDRFESQPHNSVPGLIMPDIVASAFFAAADRYDRRREPNPIPAFQLDNIMARRNNRQSSRPAGYGVKLMPALWNAELDEDQYRIFRHYGYIDSRR